MCKKWFFLVSPVLLLALAGSASAGKIDPASVTNGHVYLFENVGADVPDDSANSHTANLIGSPQVVDGLNGKALQFNGTSDGVHIPDLATINLATHQNRTVVALFKCADVTKSAKQCVYEEGGTTRGLTIYVHEGLVYAGGWNLSDYTPEWTGTFLSAPIGSNEWHAVAMVVRDGGAAQEDDKFEMWMDGELIGKGPGAELRSRSNDCGIGYHNSQVKYHDGNVSATGSYFEGVVDEVWILNDPLTISDLSTLMGKAWPYAYWPTPTDGAMHEDTWVSLSWKPGDLAVSHDVYLGDKFDDVNNATHESEVFRGNQTADFYVAGFPGFAYPEGLVPGTTYYWRIDEVNDADPNSPWKGPVWSFFIPPRKAYNPSPADGAAFMSPDITLTWTGGLGVKLHHVYLGDDLDTVSNATGALPRTDATYTPGSLELGKTYYWRVDEFDGAATHKGDIWSFTTKPLISITDPELRCWWKLDEGRGTNVLDWSGHGHDATFTGAPQWVDGYDGGALNFDGAGQSVIHNFADTSWPAWTMAVWAKADVLWQDNNSSIFANYASTAGGFQFSFDPDNNYRYHSDIDFNLGPASLGWVHLAVSYDGTLASGYYNGELVGTFTPAPDDLLFNKFGIGVNRAEDNWFDGSVDDLRVYTKALTLEEIQLVMRIDPLLAWKPSPADGVTVDIEIATPLSWSPGDKASQHEVYLGTDKDAVANADTSDTTGIYRGRQSGTSYTPPEGVEWGGGPYYWRIDENNNDGTVTKGRIWTFTVADFRLIDDFESYDAADNQIWYAWHDGLGYGSPSAPPYFAGNGTGAVVGDENTASYTEETIIHGGGQSMPLWYDNNKQGFAKYSEVEFTLNSPRDWSKYGVGELSLWFRGYPGSVGSFVEAPAGTYTMTGSGVDIWGTADQFHFAYKTLTGAGSIVAKVESVANTHAWAKAGVMIRETLDAGSKHAFACVTPGNGVAFQGRTDTDTASFSTNQTGLAAPYWVKLERDAAGNFTASHSANGTTWQPVTNAVPQNIPMSSVVYIGLALTSHDAAQTCQAKFSSVSTTGTVSPQWAHQDVGISSNAPEPLYVAVSNTTGQPGVVVHPDPAAATIDTWTEWVIPLSAFSDKGINLANMDRLAIGLGTRGNQTTPGGSGKMYFDDIRLYQPRTP